MTRPTLDGVLVVELATTPAAAYCGRLLADRGARVVKVEPPEGEPIRNLPPHKDDDPGTNNSGAHLFLNANKESVVLDTGSEEDLAHLRQLLAKATIVVEDHQPGTLSSWGCGYDQIVTDRPDLIMISITPFGQTGAYASRPATDMTVAAMGGWMFNVGEPDLPPLRPPGHQISMLGGLWGAIAAVALIEPAKNGLGDHVDVSLVEASIVFQMNVTTTYEYSGSLSPRRGGSSDVNYPQGVFPCKDGLVGVNVLYYVEWDRFCDFMGHPEWRDDPRLETPLLRAENRHIVEPVLLEWLSRHTAEEVYRLGQEAKLPFAKVSTARQLIASEQLEARDYWRSYDHPELGRIVVPGPPFRMSRASWEIRRPAPDVGQDTERVLSQLSIEDWEDIAGEAM